MAALQKDTETTLVERLGKGDEGAFEQLYTLYSPRLFGHLLRLVKAEALAVELLQDVFVKLWTNRARVDSTLSFRSYLFRIAENTVYDFFRKASRDKRLQKQIMEGASAQYHHVEEAVLLKEDLQLLQGALDSLSPQRRQVFQLIKIDGKSYAEVSTQLNISTSTVSDHVVKATKFIRRRLSSEGAITIGLFIFFTLRA